MVDAYTRGSRLRRRRGPHDCCGIVRAQRVTNIELFFDLVCVFAVTQLSHHLLGDPIVRGALLRLTQADGTFPAGPRIWKAETPRPSDMVT